MPMSVPQPRLDYWASRIRVVQAMRAQGRSLSDIARHYHVKRAEVVDALARGPPGGEPAALPTRFCLGPDCGLPFAPAFRLQFKCATCRKGLGFDEYIAGSGGSLASLPASGSGS